MNSKTDRQFNSKKPPIWLNLEYLSAESFALRCHGLPSPVMGGSCAGMTKWFFYPGFTPGSGGLLREIGLQTRLQTAKRDELLGKLRVRAPAPDECLVTLFCYEPQPLAAWFAALAAGSAFVGKLRTHLLVAPGRPTRAVRHALQTLPRGSFSEENASLSQKNQYSLLRISYLSYVAQDDFDALLAIADFNCVRGEDSLVRALWAGKPLLWHIYPQHDGAHLPKLRAWLDAMQAPDSVRTTHAAWNADSGQPMPPIHLPQWQAWAAQASAALWSQSSLLDRLLAFVHSKRGAGRNP